MIKNGLFLILILSFLQSCGYVPMYASGKSIKINIDEINLTGDWELNNFIRNSLNRYSSNTESKKYKINVDTNYLENSISKDATGKTINYEYIIEVKINLISENFNKNYIFKESFKMENFSDELTKQNYEKSNKNNIANLIVNKLILQLSRLQ